MFYINTVFEPPRNYFCFLLSIFNIFIFSNEGVTQEQDNRYHYTCGNSQISNRKSTLTFTISCAICLVLLTSKTIFTSRTTEYNVLPLHRLKHKHSYLPFRQVCSITFLVDSTVDVWKIKCVPGVSARILKLCIRSDLWSEKGIGSSVFEWTHVVLWEAVTVQANQLYLASLNIHGDMAILGQCYWTIWPYKVNEATSIQL